MHTAIEKMSELFYKQHELTTVMAVVKELETKYEQLWAAIEQSNIISSSWNVVQIMKMNIDTTYDYITDLSLPSQSLPVDTLEPEYNSASQVMSQASEHR